jgi:hypothetical protein
VFRKALLRTTVIAVLTLALGVGIFVQAKPALAASSVSCYGINSISSGGCDNVYPYGDNPNGQSPYDAYCGDTGFNVGWWPSETDHWFTIYYSPNCGANWAYINYTPDGSALLNVMLLRRIPQNDGSYLYYSYGACSSAGYYYCSKAANYANIVDPDLIGPNWTTWMTNMIGAPDSLQAQVQVQIWTAAGHWYTSDPLHWH